VYIIQFWDDILRFIATIKLKETTMVIRLVSVSDRTDLPGLHDVFHAILG